MMDTNPFSREGVHMYALSVLAGLNEKRHIYGGTVPEEVVQRRRARNRVARKSRRANRLAAKR